MSIVNMRSEKSQHRKDMDLLELKHLSYEEQAEKIGMVQPRKENAPGRLCCDLPVSKGGALRKMGKMF